MAQNNYEPTHNHRFHLPKFLSRSGLKPGKKARINFVIIAVVLLLCLVDLSLNTLTMGKMYPAVSIAGKDVSLQTREQVRSVLKSQDLAHSFSVRVDDKTYITTNNELGTNYDLNTTINTAYSVGRNRSPLLSLVRNQDTGQIGYAYSIDQAKLQQFAKSIVNSAGYGAQNAKVVIENGEIGIVPDQKGLKIDEKYLNKLLALALSDGKDSSIILEPKEVEADIKVADIAAAKIQAEQLLTRLISLRYNGKSYAADKTALGHMIVFNEVTDTDGRVVLRADIAADQVAGWVQQVANQVDVAPVNKKIQVSNGTSSITQEGTDGYAINQSDAITAILESLQGNRDLSTELTAKTVAFKTEYNRTVGLDYSQYIEINLSQQRLWAWQDNQVIFSTPITSGASALGFGTPTGLFSIYGKERSRYLNGSQYGWGYNVFVDYWMPFNGGVGLHDADWRSSFGGQDYINGGSHGCVNMTKSAAAFIYGWAPIGTPVWVHT